MEGHAQKFMNRLLDELSQPTECKFCGSKRIVKYGHYRGFQRWFCNSCRRKFTESDAPSGMRTSAVQIAAALSMFYEGMSLNGIRRHLEQTYRNHPSDSTVYGWIVKFTKIAISAAKDYKPVVGNTWVADETVLKIGGHRLDPQKKGVWFWDIIDAKTRFLLASHISSARTANDAILLMEKALERAGKFPQVVITDKLQAYLDATITVFGAKTTEHIQSKGFTVKPNTNLIERFHGTLKARTKVMRGLKKRDTAKLIMDGWLIHYNFLRPHEALKNKTPAEKAGIKVPFKSWLDIVKLGGK
jgi:putative transposase